jgi:hypothetical protein
MHESTKQLNRIARQAVTDVYLSGGNGRFYWPFRLQPWNESTPSVRRDCSRYIIDSGFGDQGATVDQLIDIAHERRPDFLIPNDTIKTEEVSSDVAITETAEKVSKFLDEIDEPSFPSTVLIPLQPPHDDHYQYLRENYPRQAKRGHFALGGMKNYTPEKQVTTIKNFRDAVGYSPYIHGFGLGGSRKVILTLRRNPGLLNSVDFSTPQRDAKNGEISGVQRKSVYFGPAQGDSSATTTAHIMLTELSDICRMLAPTLTDEKDLELSNNDPTDSPSQTSFRGFD